MNSLPPIQKIIKIEENLKDYLNAPDIKKAADLTIEEDYDFIISIVKRLLPIASVYCSEVIKDIVCKLHDYILTFKIVKNHPVNKFFDRFGDTCHESASIPYDLFFEIMEAIKIDLK